MKDFFFRKENFVIDIDTELPAYGDSGKQANILWMLLLLLNSLPRMYPLTA